MIFAKCQGAACETLLQVAYESGDEPCGAGVFERVTCPDCGAPTFVERVSIDGHSYSEAEFLEMSGGELRRVNP